MKQTYVEIVKDMFKSYEPEVRQALNGQINPYCYEKERTEEWGDGDKNYNNRLRLSYGLCYCEGFDWRTQDFSQLVRRLFSEELKDRETNSFQGIGDALENLTFLLGRYGEKEDEPLFQRAKNANFDCACGYDRALEVPEAVEEYDCDDWIYIAFYLKETETALKLMECWKKEQPQMGMEQYKKLRTWAESAKNREEVEGYQKKILELVLETGKDWDICSAYKDYIQILTQEEKYPEALWQFQNLIPHLEPSVTADRGWYGIGLGRMVLESAMDLIRKDEQCENALWLWCRTYLLKGRKNLHGNLYEKSIAFGEQKKDEEFTEKMQREYDKLLGQMGRISRRKEEKTEKETGQ